MKPLLDREIGRREHSLAVAEDWATASTAGFSPTTVLDQSRTNRFVRHPLTNDLFIADRGNIISRHLYLGIDEESRTPKHHYLSNGFTYPLTDDISAFDLLPASNGIFATTYGGVRQPTIWIRHPSSIAQEGNEQFVEYSFDMPTISAASALPTFSQDPNFVPPAYTEMIALATGEGLRILSLCPDGDRHTTNKFTTSSDVQSLCWLAPNMLSFGCRDGRILVYDPRSNGCSHVLTHSTVVSRILPTDDFTRIVCAGVSDTLMLYDMRMSKHTSVSPHEIQPSQKRRRFKENASKTRSASVPLLVFPHQNSDYNDLGLDTYPALGLLAGTDAESNLLIWSLRTGTVLRRFVPQNRGGLVGGRERCVRFVENDDENGSLSIWSTFNDGAICRFGW